MEKTVNNTEVQSETAFFFSSAQTPRTLETMHRSAKFQALSNAVDFL